MQKGKKTVFVGMSGGVDSSTAAALLQKQGYNVVGIHLKCFNVDGCAAADAEDARRAAEILNIPFYSLDFEKEYKDIVVKYMIDGYKKGITPNPDVMCNKEIKFGLFYKKAVELGADYVATGHYVKKVGSSKSEVLAIAKDKNKDQSYFLWAIKSEQLKRCLFPLGEYLKPEVRKIAEKFGLHNAGKKDSQGICFLGKVTLQDFLKSYMRPKAGVVLNTSGEKIGTHEGAFFYTIGQRSGLASGNWKRAEKGIDQLPFYVAKKNIKKNTVTVVEGDTEDLYQKEIQLTDLNLFTDKLPQVVYARVRYRQPLEKAKLSYIPNSRELGNRLQYSKKISKGWKLTFFKPVKFIAVGQSAVFYDKAGTLIGGGVIKSTN